MGDFEVRRFTDTRTVVLVVSWSSIITHFVITVMYGFILKLKGLFNNKEYKFRQMKSVILHTLTEVYPY